MPGGSGTPPGRCAASGRLCPQSRVLGPAGGAQPGATQGGGGDLSWSSALPKPSCSPDLVGSVGLGVTAVHCSGRGQRAAEEVCVILPKAMAGHGHFSDIPPETPEKPVFSQGHL